MSESHAANLLGRARRNARLMTVRGLLIRVIGFVTSVLLLGLVAPAEFGLYVVVRGTAGFLEQVLTFGLTLPLLRREQDPTRPQYAAFASAQLLALAVVAGAAALWPHPFLGFGAIDSRWEPWMLAVLVAMFAVAFGTGARIRLERELRYGPIALLEASGTLLHSLLLVGFALAGHFEYGVFVAQIVVVLAMNAALFLLSPGPLPSRRMKAFAGMARESAGFSLAESLALAREHLTPVLIAALFNLRIAGLWGLAVRLGRFLQFAFEGFGRVGVPAASHLAASASGLRRLATESLSQAAAFTIPLAGAVVVSLPALLAIWPEWEDAVVIGQLYVLGVAIAGVYAAAQGPVMVVRRGWQVLVGQEAVAILVGWAGLVILAWAGSEEVALVVLPMHLAGMAALYLMSDADLRPGWSGELDRLALALGTGLALYAGGEALDAPAVAVAVAGTLGILAWLHPLRRAASIRSRFAAG